MKNSGLLWTHTLEDSPFKLGEEYQIKRPTLFLHEAEKKTLKFQIPVVSRL